MGLWACAALHEGGRFVPVASLGLRYCYTMYAYPLLMATTCFSCIAGWQSFLFVHKWCETTIAPAPCKGGSRHPLLWMFHLLLDRGPALTAKQKPASDPDPVESEPLRVPLQQHPQPQAGRTRDVPTGHYFHTASPKQRGYRALCARCARFAKSRPFSTTGRQFFGCRIAAGYYCRCVSL